MEPGTSLFGSASDSDLLGYNSQFHAAFPLRVKRKVTTRTRNTITCLKSAKAKINGGDFWTHADIGCDE